jgi:hypothetical protein
MVLPASRRQVFRSPIVSFCRQDAGSTLNRYLPPTVDRQPHFCFAACSGSGLV